MASSNRHWPSMFKSKPCNTHHQWQHDINPSLMSSCQKSPYASGVEEKSPEPKPRWNPKPEQIRILETIFNSGMVNPPREEIRRIRAQLQEFGQVGDANVFYWFQNRKSRSKHKQRHLHNTKPHQTQPIALATTTALAAPSSSSSSSSDRTNSPKMTQKAVTLNGLTVLDTSNSPTASVNQHQPFVQTHGDFLSEQFLFPVGSNAMFTQGFGCHEMPSMVHIPDQIVGNYPGIPLTELLSSRKVEEEKIKMQQQQQEQQLSYTMSTTATIPTTTIPITTTNAEIISSSTSTNTSLIDINQVQGVCDSGIMGPAVPAAAAKSMVFINEMAFEVCLGPFNVRQAFGDDVILINSSCQPVPINEWGVTLQSLQPGALYYLARTSNMFDYLT